MVVCSAASVKHLFLLFSHLVVTYLHSPFPFEVASHLPPFRHDSVGREHFRPVDHMKNIFKTSLNQRELNTCSTCKIHTVNQAVRINRD